MNENLPATTISDTPTTGRPLPAVGDFVFDQSTHQKVQVTAIGQGLMDELHNQIFASKVIQADALHKILSTRVYTQHGFHSFDEYIEEKWDFTPRQAKYLAMIGEKRTLMIDAVTMSGGDTERLGGLLASVNQRSWRALSANLSDDDLRRLAVSDTWVSPEGKEMSLEQITAMTSGDLAGALKGTKRDLLDAKEQIRTMKAELAEYEKLGTDGSSVAKDLAAKLEKAVAERDMLKGRTAKEAATLEQIRRAEAECLAGPLSVLRNAIPRDEEEAATVGESAIVAAAIAMQLAGRFRKIAEEIFKLYPEE